MRVSGTVLTVLDTLLVFSDAHRGTTEMLQMDGATRVTIQGNKGKKASDIVPGMLFTGVITPRMNAVWIEVIGKQEAQAT
jgi:hypothetical protein